MIPRPRIFTFPFTFKFSVLTSIRYHKRRATVLIVPLCDQSRQLGIQLPIILPRGLALSVHSMNTYVHPVGRQEQQRTSTAPICISCPHGLIGHITCCSHFTKRDIVARTRPFRALGEAL